ncbi:YjjG family noncanonical pyrimidine nucleotidase [Gramella sp. AN32]|uniref:YjjG family noncanonical pyrimidine nucleotidase n=1 Tax=Christiangramia antarctica TaxID=2058158 RepID=A0ABW5X4K5_9FLAO|nr:YjjG family noncanonical pyrimidine nucleotidase [Gramella sp. AN32]MCM4157503.1 noncanonical pyrimidine nucleotidase, YjjG family [Gramella sp. AN32]
MKLHNIKHVYFDLDHTLWDFERNSELAFAEVFKKQNLGLQLADFLKVYQPINFKYWELYRNNEVSSEDLRYGRLKESFESLEFTVEDALVTMMAEDYIEFLPKNNHLLQDTIIVLDILKEKYDLHIITNGFEEVQHKKMKGAGISHYFKTITTSEEAGVKKPHSGIFEKALGKTTAIAENSVMIGDNLEADVLGAVDFGMFAVYLDPVIQKTQNQYIQIQKLKELLNYL